MPFAARVLEPLDPRPPSSGSGTARPDLHTHLYWESTGDGPPLLLVMGLGLSGGAWWRTVATLSRGFRVITFDNRGVGRSRGLTPAYTTEALADDAAAVLDAARRRAGPRLRAVARRDGRPAARAAPSTARPLARARGDDARRPPRAASPTTRSWPSSAAAPSSPREEAAWASVAYNYGRRCRDEHADRIAEDIRRRLAYNFDEAAYQAQLMAAALHNCTSRLGRIERARPRHPRRGRPRGARRQRASDREPPARRPPPPPAAHRPPLHDRGARGRHRGRRASSRPSPRPRAGTRAPLRRRAGRRSCRDARRRRAAATRPRGSPRPARGRSAGGTMRSSAPWTTSVGAVIAPSRAPHRGAAPPRAARGSRRDGTRTSAGARSPRRSDAPPSLRVRTL